ncbi:hypothetical protein ABBQ32_004234 [Trebouxia sp. C0010 RCD-2024]
MSEGAVSPKKGLFQSLSKRVSGYRSKKKSEQHPSSPGSQGSESASESLRSVDVEVDLLEVQVSGKSARSAKRLTSRRGLTHLKSAPAGAFRAAAELAVADSMSASSSGSPQAAADSSTPVSPGSPSRLRWNRSQSHMDIPKSGSQAITSNTGAVMSESAAGSSSPVPLLSSHSTNKQVPSPFLRSPAAAPEVQQAPVNIVGTTLAQALSSKGPQLVRPLSRKVSGNKLIVSSDDNMEAKAGEVMLPPQATPFAKPPEGVDDLEICFSGKSARMTRGRVRQPDVQPIVAH